MTDASVKIACVADQTGPIADVGIMLGEAPKHYISSINDQGGINGRKIIYLLEDDRYSIPVGIAAFKKLVFKDKIFAIMGPYNTGTARAIFSHIKKYKIPDVAFPAHPSLVNPLRKYLFLTGEAYDDDIGVIFEYIMKELKPIDPKIAFFTYDGESGKEVLDSSKKWARLFKLKHPIHKEIIPLGAMEASSQVMSIKRKGVTHVLVHHSAPGAAVLLRELKKFGLNIPVFASLLSCTEDTVKLAGEASHNYIGAHGFSSWYDDNPGMKKLREATLKYAPGTDKPWRTKSYTGSWVVTMLLLEGISRAERNLNPESCIDGLHSIRDFDTQGICGPITFSPTRHKGKDSARLFKADPSSGKLIPITDWKSPPKFKE
ncbi:MAG: ABC transporter substrate-binding protein [Thermodesulfobacteriota bacterium]|nr:ABC transporter substrate-binding protein [Thermodesulfobacteriota bacterium]